ncbi:hypothetical protein C8Q73DRAFT_711361 [Cubamyces lactineus]|nr:hypothetical protein C8Q73DRAFT_711361 [Cubamyces lactineus]
MDRPFELSGNLCHSCDCPYHHVFSRNAGKAIHGHILSQPRPEREREGSRTGNYDTIRINIKCGIVTVS